MNPRNHPASLLHALLATIALLALVPSLSAGSGPASPAPLAAGDILFDLNLNDPAARARLETQGAVITNGGPDGGPALRLTTPAPAAPDPNTRLVTIPLDIKKLRGATLALACKFRGEDIRSADPRKPILHYHGGKAQILLHTESRGDIWLDTSQQPVRFQNTFPWQETYLLANIPRDATEGRVNFGLQNCAGAILFSQVTLKVLKAPVARRPTPATRAAAAAARTTMRGVMAPNVYRKKDFQDLATWNVNSLRWQMLKPDSDSRPYDQWLAAKLDECAVALDDAAARRMKLVIDLHSAPGGRTAGRTLRMLLEKPFADQFVATWQTIARRFKDHPGLWAYDLINEPVQNAPSPDGVDDWLAIQVRAARAVREIDPRTPIMIETDAWASPESFATLVPVDVPGIIYQAHMYWPSYYTHQGVKTNQGVADGQKTADTHTYPGTAFGQRLDKDALRRYLSPIREFQLATGAPIYIGEFSAVRWAPGAAQYLDDLISIFEEYGWDWAYHAFREWRGWSVEHADLPADRQNHPAATTPTERQKVLLKWFAQNQPQP